ncbi:MAG: acyltransferase [Lachnospiraceae bacterium]
MNRSWQFDYLKAICICCIIITHITYPTASPRNFLFPYFVDMAVPVFLIISGYLNTQSCEKRNKTMPAAWFYPRPFLKKVINIYLPFVIIWGIEIILIIVIQQEPMYFKDCIYGLLTGGRGPGSYYIPILLQFIIIFPLFYLLLNKNLIWGSLFILFLQVTLEIGTQWMQIPVSFYRLLIFRYFIFIWVGMMLYRYEEKLNSKMLLFFGIFGAAYIWVVVYSGYEPKIFRYWTGTSMPTALWATSLVLILKRGLKRLPHPFNQIICTIGQSTYYIFLIQMLYYAFGFDNKINSIPMRIIINIVVCCGGGILFRFMEQKLRSLFALTFYQHKKTK